MESAISFESANLHLRFLYVVSFESSARRARQWGAAQLGKYTAGAFAAAGGTDRAGGRCARAGSAAVPSAAPVGHAGGGARIRDSGTAADSAVSGGVSETGVLIFPVSDGILRCGGARI